MPGNIEIKARVGDAASVRRKVDALDVIDSAELQQTDTFFCAPLGRLKLREFGDGSAELIGYQRADTKSPSHSEYHKATIADAAELKAALTMTLGTKGIVRKTRSLRIVGQTRVHLDHVDGLGDFVELEVMLTDGQSDIDGERIAQEFLETLGIARAQLVPVAYIDLLGERE